MGNLNIDNFSGCVSILQLDNISNSDRILIYIKSLSKNSIILFGEYVLDPFFSEEWLLKPDKFLKDRSKLDFIVEISKDYNHTIVLPCIQYKNKGYYKSIAIVHDGNVHYYSQQRLIQYPHWNEVDFFSNDISKLPKLPFTFTANDIKFGVLFGFETHFDEFWMELKKADVDVVLVSTANTFSSQERWKNLLTTHAFTNSCYVFRANKIGKHVSKDGYEWDFYGHSFVSLGCDILDSINNEEGMLCIDINKQALEELKKEWGFRTTL